MHNAIIRIIDGINDRIGKWVGWLTLLLVLITVYDVIMRYFFRAGSVAIQEAEVHLFAMNFLLAAGWTYLNDGHVRVDILYLRFDPKTKAWIDLLGALFFCVPYCLLVIWAAGPFVMDSWAIRESSPNPGGLPATYVLKATIPVAFFLIAVQAFSQAVKKILFLTGKEKSP
jgi:TRAP-type mannitol/chloroaromatic compound transport system permease small subunit